MREFLPVIVLVLIFSPDISFSETKFTKAELSERFKLFAECKPMGIVVEHLNKDASKIGLTRKSLQYAAESRLRMARLYSSKSSHYLYINITNLDKAYSLELSFKKKVRDHFSDLNSFAVTWDIRSVGKVGNSGADFVLSVLSKYMDEFISEFLRVNEKACSQRQEP